MSVGINDATRIETARSHSFSPSSSPSSSFHSSDNSHHLHSALDIDTDADGQRSEGRFESPLRMAADGTDNSMKHTIASTIRSAATTRRRQQSAFDLEDQSDHHEGKGGKNKEEKTRGEEEHWRKNLRKSAKGGSRAMGGHEGHDDQTKGTPPRRSGSSVGAAVSFELSEHYHRGGLEVALLNEKSEKDTLTLEVMRLRAQISRERDDKEVVRCKLLRVEGEAKALESELGEVHHEVRKAKQECEHYRRAHKEALNLKAQLGASRDQLSAQIAEANETIEDLKAKVRSLAESKESLASAHEVLRRRAGETEISFAEAKVRIDHLELELLTAKENERLAQSSAAVFHDQLSVETERLAAYFRSMGELFDAAVMFPSHLPQNPSSNSHLLPPHKFERRDDELAAATELLIFENAKRAPLTVPLYTSLHAALRDLSIKHKLLRKELFSRGEVIARTTLVATDLNTALEENNSLSMRVARLEAQLDAARDETRHHEREAKAAREHLSSVLCTIFEESSTALRSSSSSAAAVPSSPSPPVDNNNNITTTDDNEGAVEHTAANSVGYGKSAAIVSLLLAGSGLVRSGEGGIREDKRQRQASDGNNKEPAAKEFAVSPTLSSSVAIYSLCGEATGLLKRVSAIVASRNESEEGLQQEIRRLMRDLEERRIEFESQTTALRVALRTELQEAVEKTREVTVKACEEKAEGLGHLKDSLIEEITEQREALRKSNTDLKNSVEELRERLAEEHEQAEIAKEKLKRLEGLLAEESAAHRQAKMDVFVLQERVLVAEKETSGAKALRLIGSSGGGPSRPLTTTITMDAPPTQQTAAPTELLGVERDTPPLTTSLTVSATPMANTSAVTNGALVPQYNDRIPFFETLLMTLRALHGAQSDVEAMAKSARALSKFVAKTLPRGSVYASKQRPSSIVALLKFRSAVVAVLAMNRLMRVLQDVKEGGRTAYVGSSSSTGSRPFATRSFSKVRLGHDTQVWCLDGLALSPWPFRAESSSGGDAAQVEMLSLTPDTFILPTVGEAKNPTQMFSLLTGQLLEASEKARKVTQAARLLKVLENAQSEVRDAVSLKDPEETETPPPFAFISLGPSHPMNEMPRFASGRHLQRREDLLYSPTLAEVLQDGLAALLIKGARLPKATPTVKSEEETTPKMIAQATHSTQHDTRADPPPTRSGADRRNSGAGSDGASRGRRFSSPMPSIHTSTAGASLVVVPSSPRSPSPNISNAAAYPNTNNGMGMGGPTARGVVSPKRNVTFHTAPPQQPPPPFGPTSTPTSTPSPSSYPRSPSAPQYLASTMKNTSQVATSSASTYERETRDRRATSSPTGFDRMGPLHRAPQQERPIPMNPPPHHQDLQPSSSLQHLLPPASTVKGNPYLAQAVAEVEEILSARRSQTLPPSPLPSHFPSSHFVGGVPIMAINPTVAPSTVPPPTSALPTPSAGLCGPSYLPHTQPPSANIHDGSNSSNNVYGGGGGNITLVVQSPSPHVPIIAGYGPPPNQYVLHEDNSGGSGSRPQFHALRAAPAVTAAVPLVRAASPQHHTIVLPPYAHPPPPHPPSAMPRPSAPPYSYSKDIPTDADKASGTHQPLRALDANQLPSSNVRSAKSEPFLEESKREERKGGAEFSKSGPAPTPTNTSSDRPRSDTSQPAVALHQAPNNSNTSNNNNNNNMMKALQHHHHHHHHQHHYFNGEHVSDTCYSTQGPTHADTLLHAADGIPATSTTAIRSQGVGGAASKSPPLGGRHQHYEGEEEVKTTRAKERAGQNTTIILPEGLNDTAIAAGMNVSARVSPSRRRRKEKDAAESQHRLFTSSYYTRADTNNRSPTQSARSAGQRKSREGKSGSDGMGSEGNKALHRSVSSPSSSSSSYSSPPSNSTSFVSKVEPSSSSLLRSALVESSWRSQRNLRDKTVIHDSSPSISTRGGGEIRMMGGKESATTEAYRSRPPSIVDSVLSMGSSRNHITFFGEGSLSPIGGEGQRHTYYYRDTNASGNRNRTVSPARTSFYTSHGEWEPTRKADGNGPYRFEGDAGTSATPQYVNEEKSAFAKEVLNVIRALDNKIEASLARKRH